MNIVISPRSVNVIKLKSSSSKSSMSTSASIGPFSKLTAKLKASVKGVRFEVEKGNKQGEIRVYAYFNAEPKRIGTGRSMVVPVYDKISDVLEDAGYSQSSKLGWQSTKEDLENDEVYGVTCKFLYDSYSKVSTSASSKAKVAKKPSKEVIGIFYNYYKRPLNYLFSLLKKPRKSADDKATIKSLMSGLRKAESKHQMENKFSDSIVELLINQRSLNLGRLEASFDPTLSAIVKSLSFNKKDQDKKYYLYTRDGDKYAGPFNSIEAAEKYFDEILENAIKLKGKREKEKLEDIRQLQIMSE